MNHNLKKILIFGIMLELAVVFLVLKGSRFSGKSGAKELHIGIGLYKADDTFISSIRKEVENYVKEYEKENNIRIKLEITDAEGSQTLQNKQIDRFIALEYDAICINPVERTEVSGIIDKAEAANIPIVFFNREPVESDMQRAEKLYYIGIDPKESALLQGQILIDAYRKEKKLLDHNEDGYVEYLLLEGEPNHQDSLVRTEWIIKSLQRAGIPIRKLEGAVANWDRSQGAALMERWMNEYGNQIELVISNNDDMALGALDALEKNKSFSYVKTVGIDGTPQGMEAVERGALFGTVRGNSREYAYVITNLAVSAAGGSNIPQDIEEKLESGKYYHVSQESVRADHENESR
ncbi:MAG: galactose ABC transporter substrate-binding protein [Johnsonella sp.]|nr:galactose ABC transporter substrate-binding protein [Johnsonella sp.]